eukprot:1528486-Rhodomonas_salina.1
MSALRALPCAVVETQHCKGSSKGARIDTRTHRNTHLLSLAVWLSGLLRRTSPKQQRQGHTQTDRHTPTAALKARGLTGTEPKIQRRCGGRALHPLGRGGVRPLAEPTG